MANLLDAILSEDEVAWSHFPAGGYELSPAARSRLYRLGLKRGFPDIEICYSLGRTLWLECKTLTGHLSPAQRSKHILLRRLGHKVVVVRRIEDVIAALMEYDVPFRKARLAEDYRGTTVNAGDAPGSAQEHPQSINVVGGSEQRAAETVVRPVVSALKVGF